MTMANRAVHSVNNNKNNKNNIFHHTSLLPLSPPSAVVLNHISSHFLIPLSFLTLFLISTVPVQRLVRHFGHKIINFRFNI